MGWWELISASLKKSFKAQRFKFQHKRSDRNIFSYFKNNLIDFSQLSNCSLYSFVIFRFRVLFSFLQWLWNDQTINGTHTHATRWSKAMITASEYINNITEWHCCCQSKQNIKKKFMMNHDMPLYQERRDVYYWDAVDLSPTINYSKDKCHCRDVNDSSVLATDPPAVTLQDNLLSA